MDIEVYELTIKPNQYRVGFGLLRYHDMHMRFDLCYYSAAKKVWIRMPEKWINHKKKVSYCHWETKEISDRFQILTLQKLFDRFDLNESKVIEIYEHAKSLSKQHRKE